MRINAAMVKRALPIIFTIAGTVGVGVTGYLAHKGTKKADKVIESLPEEEKPENSVEEFKKTWKCYIPSMVSGGVTVGLIIAGHVLSAKEIAALTATCAYLTKNRDKLEDKLRDAIGEEKYNEIKKKLAGEELHKITTLDGPGVSVEDTGIGSEHDRILCFEGYSGRWFWSTIDAVNKAEERLNEKFGAEDYVCLNDFYELLHIERTHFGYEFGWVNNPDYYDGPINFTNTKVFYEEKGCDVYIIEIDTYPMECWAEV